MRNRQTPIRFGVISSSTSVPAWQVESIKRALQVDGVELVLVVFPLHAGIDAESNSAAGNAAPDSRSSSMWLKLQSKLKARLPALNPTPVQGQDSGLECLHCAFTDADSPHYELDAADVARIRDADLDFILSLSPQRPAGAVRGAARHGVWFFQLGKDQSRNSAIGFWEIYNREPLSYASLQQALEAAESSTPGLTHADLQTDELPGVTVRVIRAARLRTIDGSHTANVAQLLAESSRWLAQACIDISTGVDPACGELKAEAPPQSDNEQISAPSNLQCMKFGLRLRLNKVRNFLSHFLVHRHWRIALAFSPVQELWQQPETARVEMLPIPSQQTFHADPFGMMFEGGLAVLFEEWNRDLGAGKIAGTLLDSEDLEALANNDDGRSRKTASINPSAFRTSFDFPHHCSYPFLFSHDGETYCIPETGDAGAVGLYRCQGHPGKWEHIKNIITDFAAVDSSVVFHDGKWWLFCANLDDNPNSHLFIYYADELTGEWHAHQGNPVKMDVCGGRPAGTPFELDGQLYRPSQDNSRNYGGGITIQKITRLTPDGFAEEPCADLTRLTAQLAVGGMHTLARVGRYTLLDYYHQSFIPSVFVYRLKQYLRARQAA